jgi:hypothetical protein
MKLSSKLIAAMNVWKIRKGDAGVVDEEEKPLAPLSRFAGPAGCNLYQSVCALHERM